MFESGGGDTGTTKGERYDQFVDLKSLPIDVLSSYSALFGKPQRKIGSEKE